MPPQKSHFRLNKGMLVVTLQDVERLIDLVFKEPGGNLDSTQLV